MAQGGREKKSLRQKTEKRGRGKSLHKVGETTKENQEGEEYKGLFWGSKPNCEGAEKRWGCADLWIFWRRWIPLEAKREQGLSRVFPGMVLVIYYALIHILFFFILLLIPRHCLYWYGHHDHLFVCWIWLFVSLLCFSPILGFFVFPSVSSRIHSWVWYLVIIYLLPCLSHLFIARWFETWNAAFLGSFCFYFLCSVFGYLSPFPILIYEDSSKYCRSMELKFGRTRWKENAGNTVISYLARAEMVQVLLEVIHPLYHSNYQHIQEYGGFGSPSSSLENSPSESK